MQRRFVSIWFRYLLTDWFTVREPRLKNVPFVLRAPAHGRMIITAANPVAVEKGIYPGMVLADARAIFPGLEVRDDKHGIAEKLLKRFAEWCIRFSPVVAVDSPEGLFIDASGCTHLWGGDGAYLEDIKNKFSQKGYETRVAIADTPGVAWAEARYGNKFIIDAGNQFDALLTFPPEALRVDKEITEKLHKLGLHEVRQFISMPRASLRRRFGTGLICAIDRALGHELELLRPVIPPEPFQERLPSMDPIGTAKGIEIALQQLLESLCYRLRQEQKGLRKAVLRCFRVDGKTCEVQVETNRPSHNVRHLTKLFEIRLPSIEPGLGIELFILEAPKVETHLPEQEQMWKGSGGLDDIRLSELLDRLAGKIGKQSIHRYLPDEHYWPERSFKPSESLQEKSLTPWRADKIRPLHVLRNPECIEVTAPIPDYPPMLFRYKGCIHKIVKADGPERIEQEWWIQQGQHRDYYRVEDENGNRYWLFRSGHYHDKSVRWFLHGFFS